MYNYIVVCQPEEQIDLIKFLKNMDTLGKNVKIGFGVWALKTNAPANMIRIVLSASIEDDSVMFVARLGVESAWSGISETSILMEFLK